MLKTNQLEQSDFKGISRCARYGFMPNRLSFCGPDKNKDLFHYCHSQQADQGLKQILEEFQTLYPYLKFIARYNQIKDPFDEEVVEAYWIGNHLLENISKSQFYNHLSDNLQVKKKLTMVLMDKLNKKIALGAKAHHNFHVLSVWKQADDIDSWQVLTSMDLCRISWGKIKKIKQSHLEVEYQPLVLEDNKLSLGEPVWQKINYRIGDKGFIEQPKQGDWISMHWGFACEVLSDWQIANLKKYTQESIALANMG
jgi:hypothetical protein